MTGTAGGRELGLKGFDLGTQNEPATQDDALDRRAYRCRVV
jgi:hypothetical protein